MRARAARAPTIRSRLAVLVTACVVPMSLMAAALIVYNYQRESAQLRQDLGATARALASAVDRELAAVKAALHVLATSPTLRPQDLAAFHAQALQVLRVQPADNIVLTDTAGRQRVNTFRPYGAPLPALVMPQLERILATGEPYVSDVFVGEVARRPAVSVSVPVRLDGRIRYNLSMGFTVEHVASLLREQRLPEGWSAEVLDSAGRVIARTLEAERPAGEWVFASGRSAVSAWRVVLGIPQEAMTAQLRRSLAWLLLGTAAVLGASLACAHALGGRLLRQARYEAQHDPLTGLGNRARLEDALEQQLALSRRLGSGLALLYIDLDGFKPVNDRHGHAAGDELLRAVARRLEQSIRRTDLAVRLGGDEFAVVLFATGAQAAQQVARKLEASLAAPYAVGDAHIAVSASIGIACAADAGATRERLLQQADAAMYAAKARARNAPGAHGLPGARRPSVQGT